MRPIGLKLAMKIAGEYPSRNIAARHWKKLAVETHLNPDELLTSLHAMAERMPDHVSAVRKRSREEGLAHEIIDRLSDRLIARATECEERFK
jgi:hypothetical protein